jgi:hypothetical protein
VSDFTDEQIKHMVERFLSWKLPENFNPDCGISFKRTQSEQGPFGSQRYEPSGTNLFDYGQAKAMVQHMIEGMPAALSAQPQPEAVEPTMHDAMMVAGRLHGLGVKRWREYGELEHKDVLEALRLVWPKAAPPLAPDERMRRALEEALADNGALRSANTKLVLAERDRLDALSRADDDKDANAASLFQQGNFMSAAGLPLTWKIECDALTNADWQTIALASINHLPPFRRAVGVPRGGIKLARELDKHSTTDANLTLVVDDVWTTGKSLTEHARAHVDGEWHGFVAFSRGDLPSHVSCFLRTL